MTLEQSPFEDDQAAIEHALLWSDLLETIAAQSETLGVHMSDSDTPEFLKQKDKVVLQSAPYDGIVLQLWGVASHDALVGEVHLSYQREDSGVEQYMYEVDPERIVFYGWRVGQSKKTTFGREEISELRAEIQEETWDAEATRKAAETHQYFSP